MVRHPVRTLRVIKHRIISGALLLFLGPLGLLIAFTVLRLSKWLLTALWTGVLERVNMIDGTGDVTFLMTKEPVDFFFNFVFWSFVSLILGLISTAILWPIIVYVHRSFRKQREP